MIRNGYYRIAMHKRGRLPEEVKVAQLCIYNLQGTQIKQIVVVQRGEGLRSELAAGIYLYALIVDGKLVDAKQMVLTK